MATKKMTMAEKIAQLEELKEIEDILNTYLKSVTDSLEWEYKTNDRVGEEPEQAKNGDGELLFKDASEGGWLHGTKEKLLEKGVKEMVPYHKTIYKERIRTYAELSDYEKPRVDRLTAVKLFFEELDIEALFPAYLAKAKKLNSGKK